MYLANKQSILVHTYHRYEMNEIRTLFVCLVSRGNIWLDLNRHLPAAADSSIMFKIFNKNLPYYSRAANLVVLCLWKHNIQFGRNNKFPSIVCKTLHLIQFLTKKENPETTCTPHIKWCQPTNSNYSSSLWAPNTTVRRRHHRHSNRAHFFIFCIVIKPFRSHRAPCSPSPSLWFIIPFPHTSLTPTAHTHTRSLQYPIQNQLVERKKKQQ